MFQHCSFAVTVKYKVARMNTEKSSIHRDTHESIAWYLPPNYSSPSGYEEALMMQFRTACVECMTY